MPLREHIFSEITTYEYPMWRRSYIAGTMKVMIDETESSGECSRGEGVIREVVNVQRPRLYDDYTDLHGGVDSLSRSSSLEEIKKLIEGKEGSFIHQADPEFPKNTFTLKKQFPLEVKPVGSPFG